jgi:hypothetical protein
MTAIATTRKVPVCPAIIGQRNDVKAIRRMLVSPHVWEHGRTRPLLDALVLLGHLEPGQTETAIRCHHILRQTMIADLNGLGVLDDWITPLLYKVMDYAESDGYWYQDEEWYRRSEWRLEDGRWELYDGDCMAVPRRGGVRPA